MPILRSIVDFLLSHCNDGLRHAPNSMRVKGIYLFF